MAGNRAREIREDQPGGPAPLPLRRLRVLDLTHALAGPYCTMLLGDLGADVLKVEAPGRGDQTRGWGPPFVAGESSYFMSVNRNKRSVALDLKSQAGRRAAQGLAAQCDVVVENLRVGSAAGLGLSASALRSLNPRLVYASISGFGPERPSMTGYDQIAQGTAGMMLVSGGDGEAPVKVGIPIGDLSAGMFTAHAVLAALVERGDGGQGRTIEVTLNDSLLAMQTYLAGILFATGQPPPRSGNQHATIVPYGAFATRDGYINIAVGSNPLFERLCAALETEELLQDPRFGDNSLRQANRRELLEILNSRLGRRCSSQWLERLEKFGVPAGPILGLDQAFASPLARERGALAEVDHPVAGRIGQVAAPWRLDGQASPIRLPPPTLGQHTTEVLSELLGYGPDEVRLASGGEQPHHSRSSSEVT